MSSTALSVMGTFLPIIARYFLMIGAIANLPACSDDVNPEILFKPVEITYPRIENYEKKRLPNGDVLLQEAGVEEHLEHFGIVCTKGESVEYKVRYEGGILDGEYHGNGRLVLSKSMEAQLYVGAFKHGKMSGYGIQRENSLGLVDSLYFGQFKDGLKHGRGSEFEYMAGWIYRRGEYLNDKFQKDSGFVRFEFEMSPNLVKQVFDPLKTWWEAHKFTQEKQCKAITA